MCKGACTYVCVCVEGVGMYMEFLLLYMGLDEASKAQIWVGNSEFHQASVGVISEKIISKVRA